MADRVLGAIILKYGSWTRVLRVVSLIATRSYRSYFAIFVRFTRRYLIFRPTSPLIHKRQNRSSGFSTVFVIHVYRQFKPNLCRWKAAMWITEHGVSLGSKIIVYVIVNTYRNVTSSKSLFSAAAVITHFSSRVGTYYVHLSNMCVCVCIILDVLPYRSLIILSLKRLRVLCRVYCRVVRQIVETRLLFVYYVDVRSSRFWTIVRTQRRFSV